MKARDLITELMRHNLDLDVFVGVSIHNLGSSEEKIDVPLGKVEWKNDGGANSPRLVIEAPATIVVETEHKFSVE
jgi:hypothetical protein